MEAHIKTNKGIIKINLFYDLLRKKGLNDAADALLDSYKKNVINFGKELKQIPRKMI